MVFRCLVNARLIYFITCYYSAITSLMSVFGSLRAISPLLGKKSVDGAGRTSLLGGQLTAHLPDTDFPR